MIAPIDAEKMNLLQEDQIRVTSATGEIKRPIKINKDIQGGYIHIPTAYHQNDARCLIQLAPLLDADSGGWDTCQVTVEKVENMKME